jgi:hypothetical protein
MNEQASNEFERISTTGSTRKFFRDRWGFLCWTRSGGYRQFSFCSSCLAYWCWRRVRVWRRSSTC